jgi:hypothetical protein
MQLPVPVDVVLLLSAALCGWQKNNGLPQESADEQLCNRKELTENQKEWLRAFCNLWDQQTENFNVEWRS